MQFAKWFSRPDWRKLRKETSHRDFLTWREWYKGDWNRPSRSDYYLMQLSADIHNVLNATQVEPEQRKLSWNWTITADQTVPSPITEDEREKMLNDAYEASWRSVEAALKQRASA